jgi:hypothetical protein
MSGALPVNAVSANGAGVVPDSLLNAFVQDSGTASQLRGFIGLSGMSVMLQGITAPGDGLGGLFYWSVGNFTDDNLNTIVPSATAGQGAWLRISLYGPYLPLAGGTLTGPTELVIPGVFTNLQENNAFAVIVNGLTPTIARSIGQEPGIYNTEALFGGVTAPVSATVPEVDGLFASALTYSSATYAVGGAIYAASLVAGTIVFGLNVLVGDGFDVKGSGSGGTYYPNGVIGCEWDVGAGSIDSTVLGNNMIGVFPNGTPGSVFNPSYPLAQATAYQVSVQGAPWSTAFLVFDGAALIGIYLGAIGTTANSDGQPIRLAARDGSNVLALGGIQMFAQTSGAYLAIANTNGGIKLVAEAGSVVASNQPVALPSYTIASGPSQLPAASSAYTGCIAYVTDFNGSPTYRGAIGSGGGSTGITVFCNGSAWFTN